MLSKYAQVHVVTTAPQPQHSSYCELKPMRPKLFPSKVDGMYSFDQELTFVRPVSPSQSPWAASSRYLSRLGQAPLIPRGGSSLDMSKTFQPASLLLLLRHADPSTLLS